MYEGKGHHFVVRGRRALLRTRRDECMTIIVIDEESCKYGSTIFTIQIKTYVNDCSYGNSIKDVTDAFKKHSPVLSGAPLRYAQPRFISRVSNF